jgi:uncharacterized protein
MAIRSYAEYLAASHSQAIHWMALPMGLCGLPAPGRLCYPVSCRWGARNDVFSGTQNHGMVRVSDPGQSAAVPPAFATTDASGSTPGAPSMGGLRPEVWADELYGEVRVSGWAAALLATPPFQRLAGVSLSDVPGELLLGRPFPSRLDHTRGVYHLARLARPRDRALQAGALAHDLGHGPFGHVTEPLMREWLGCNHEERSARKLAEVRDALTPAARRYLSWLDWDDVAALVVGAGKDQRGALLNGRLDYDNLDNVGRFLHASGLGRPTYGAAQLARALRLVPPEALAGAHAGDARHEPVFLLAQAEQDGLAWQADRARLYGYLHADHSNIAPHAMLRKAVELAHEGHALPDDFLEMTDDAALRCLAEAAVPGAAQITQRVAAGNEQRYVCALEADITAAHAARVPFAEWRAHLRWEAEVAGEAGLAPHEVIAEVVVSSAGRPLPPLSATGRAGTFVWLPAPLPAPRVLHIFVPTGTPRDYIRRLAAAAERRLAAFSIVSRMTTDAS